MFRWASVLLGLVLLASTSLSVFADDASVAAVPAGPDGWTAGSDASGSPPLRGAFDLGASVSISPGDPLVLNGWVGNLDDPSAISDVSVFDGDLSHPLGQAKLGLSRPDVVSALNAPSLATSGFSFTLDTWSLSLGQHTLIAAAHTTNNGTWTRPLGLNLVPAAPRPAGQFVYGTHLAALNHASLAQQDGFGLMWGYVPWEQVEPSRGSFLFKSKDRWGNPVANPLTNVLNAASAAGMKVILRLDEVPGWAGGSPAQLNPSDLENYVYEAVHYGHGTIAYVEVFNEPNLPYEWGGSPDPTSYARLLQAAYRGVKRADPSVQVISAAVAQKTGGLGGSMEDVDFLNGMYRAGAAGAFDLLGMHAYLGNFAPETNPGTCTPMCFRDIERFRAVMQQNGDGNKQAFITEIGALEQTSNDLGGFTWMELPSATRADYLLRALEMANANYRWVAGAMVFNFDYATVPWNPPTAEKYWFSLLDQWGRERPALRAIRNARATGALS